ncbi:MAG: hypothetical protein H7256_09995 [Bdellovibrio sp.]|nr:hypothetical protein [Bdellovibrio sp.]
MKTGYDQFFQKAKQTTTTQKRVEALQTLRKQTSKKPKKKFPVAQFFMFGILGIAGFLAVDHIDSIESQFKKIEITMGVADAAEEGHASEAKATDKHAGPEGEKVASAKEAKEGAEKSTTKEKKPDDADYLFKLAERKKALDLREEDLNKMATELEKQKADIEEKVKKLEETRGKISTVLQERIKADDAKVETLVQMYSNMKPQQVAKVFETLDEDLVIDILGRMKKKTAADILNLIKPEKAQIFAERFTGYRAPANSN